MTRAGLIGGWVLAALFMYVVGVLAATVLAAALSATVNLSLSGATIMALGIPCGAVMYRLTN